MHLFCLFPFQSYQDSSETTSIERLSIVWFKMLVFLDINFGSLKYPHKLISDVNPYLNSPFMMQDNFQWSLWKNPCLFSILIVVYKEFCNLQVAWCTVLLCIAARFSYENVFGSDYNTLIIGKNRRLQWPPPPGPRALCNALNLEIFLICDYYSH